MFSVGPDDPRWNSVWYRPRNRRSIRPRFFMRGSIVPQNGRYKEPLILQATSNLATAAISIS
jgi:hypothetical protein